MRRYVVDLVLEATSEDAQAFTRWASAAPDLAQPVAATPDGLVFVTVRQRAGDAPEAVGLALARLGPSWSRVADGEPNVLAAWARRDRMRARQVLVLAGGRRGDGPDGDFGGVREPRRPSPSPGHLHVARPIPTTPNEPCA